MIYDTVRELVKSKCSTEVLAEFDRLVMLDELVEHPDRFKVTFDPRGNYEPEDIIEVAIFPSGKIVAVTVVAGLYLFQPNMVNKFGSFIERKAK